MKSFYKRHKKLCITLGVLFTLLLSFVVWFKIVTHIDPPQVADMSALDLPRENQGDTYYSIGRNKLRKNKYGLWEMYVEGNAFTRGAVFGKLNKELIYKQEKAFVDQIRVLVPSDNYLKFLKYMLAFFNRNLDENVSKEQLQEIYGISFAHPDEFDFIGSKYSRVLNYHAAHDIGHALRQYMLVGCTSFAEKGSLSEDSNLIMGRNFDFYAGDAFAENKIVAFWKPDSGHAFMTVTWPGFIGAVSGMNDKGLALTINAAASHPPLSTKTPIALLTREILQYAETVDEAMAIAQSRETFVSESIMISSAKDNRSVIIEKSPETTALFESENDCNVCSNHYQSEAFSNNEMNIENIQNSDSPYRFDRTLELLNQSGKLNPEKVAAILRNKEGLAGKKIGYGNQKSINQLIAHHAVIFRPENLQVWVSAPPYQLGTFVCYDLKKVFASFPDMKTSQEICEESLNIAPDPFLKTTEYRGFEHFRKMKGILKFFTGYVGKTDLTQDFLLLFERSNPDFYHTYEMLGDYYKARGNCYDAEPMYQKALALEIASVGERKAIEEKMNDCN